MRVEGALPQIPFHAPEVTADLGGWLGQILLVLKWGGFDGIRGWIDRIWRAALTQACAGFVRFRAGSTPCGADLASFGAGSAKSWAGSTKPEEQIGQSWAGSTNLGCFGPSLAELGAAPTPSDPMWVSSIGIGAASTMLPTVWGGRHHSSSTPPPASPIRVWFARRRGELGPSWGLVRSESRLVRPTSGRRGRVPDKLDKAFPSPTWQRTWLALPESKLHNAATASGHLLHIMGKPEEEVA